MYWKMGKNRGERERERERKPQLFSAPILLFNLNCCGSGETYKRLGGRRGISVGVKKGREHGAVNQLENTHAPQQGMFACHTRRMRNVRAAAKGRRAEGHKIGPKM